MIRTHNSALSVKESAASSGWNSSLAQTDQSRPIHISLAVLIAVDI